MTGTLRRRTFAVLTPAFLMLGVALLPASLEAQYPTVKTVSIESEELGQTREIMIYEPMGYAEDEYAYYDVIYVLDAATRGFFDYVSSVANMLEGDHRGFIVVGIRQTALLEEMYGRNHDLLPSDTDWKLGPTPANAEAFLGYIRNEVMPYVESHYRILDVRTAIGHSLSASFLVWTLEQDPDLFHNWVGVDPNLAYDDQRLVRVLREFESEQFDSPRFFYMSHARTNRTTPRWREANYAANNLLLDSLANDNFRVMVEQYPDEGHVSSFVPSVNSALRSYLREIRPEQVGAFSEEEYAVTVRVRVPDEEMEVWISGNQESLGGENRMRMDRVAPQLRELKVSVRDYLAVHFFEDESGPPAWIVSGEPNAWVGVPRTTYPRMIRPEEGAVYEFEIYSPSQ